MYHRVGVLSGRRWAFFAALMILASVLFIASSESNVLVAGRYLAGTAQADQALAFDPYACDAAVPDDPAAPGDEQFDDVGVPIVNSMAPRPRSPQSVWVWIPSRPPQASPIF